MMNKELDGNKIIHTNNIMKFHKEITKKYSNSICITPSTKLKEILNFKANGVFSKMLVSEFFEIIEQVINMEKLSILKNLIEEKIGIEFLEIDYSSDKILKILLIFMDDIYLTDIDINKLIGLLEMYSQKIINIFLFDLDIDLSILNQQLNLVNIIVVTSTIVNKINWNNLEMLILADIDDGLEILNKEKLLVWLESQLGFVITDSDINNYFSGEVNFNTMSITNCIQKLA